MLSQRLFARADAPVCGVRDLSPLVATLHLPELTVVDVREPEELTGALGHIPGAVNVPLSTLLTTTLGWERAAPLLIVCRSGGRSARGARALGQEGFSALFNLAGGMLAWDANGLPRQRNPHDATQSLMALLGLAFVAAYDGEVEQGVGALNAVCRRDGVEAQDGLLTGLAEAVATFEARALAADDPARGYSRLLRLGLARVGRAV